MHLFCGTTWYIHHYVEPRVIIQKQLEIHGDCCTPLSDAIRLVHLSLPNVSTSLNNKEPQLRRK